MSPGETVIIPHTVNSACSQQKTLHGHEFKVMNSLYVILRISEYCLGSAEWAG